MAHTDFSYLYPYSVEDARQRDEVSRWRESFRANIACKEAIEAAIRRDFDGMHLKDGCAQSVIAEFGYKRTAFVLANTLLEKDYDGRFSYANKEWSRRIFVPPDKDHNYQFVVDSHPAVLDGFVDEYRRSYAALALFDSTHCIPASKDMDYEGKVLVLSPDTLKESCWRQEDQLWYAHDGFGCSPNAIGRSIRCTCLGDGEHTRWNRSDFIGIIREELLPDWAKEQVEQLRAGQQPAQSQDCPGPEMKL